MTSPSSPATPAVRVRFAPSPTGALHLGSALVALANAAIARASGGAFVLRIDDTDAARSSDDDTRELLRLLEWLGIGWSEGPVHQRDRAPAYARALERLDAAQATYPCFCSQTRLAELREAQQRAGEPPRYDGRCRALASREVAASLAAGAPHVLRFAVDSTRDVVVDDLVRGRVVVPAGSFGDPVLARSDGSAGYLLASVVDDIELEVTHVVRGEDHLVNTARQLPLFAALGATEPPRFAHLPLLRRADGRKLSKRDPDGTLDTLVEEGFLPVTVRRYLAELLGQGPVDPLAEGERPREFLFTRVPTGAPRVDRARLESIGREDMAALDPAELVRGTSAVLDDALLAVLRELAPASPSRGALRAELRLVLDGPAADALPAGLAQVASTPEELAAADLALELATRVLREHIEGEAAPVAPADGWAAAAMATLRRRAKADGLGVRSVLQPLRVALTGAVHGPGLDLLLAAIGAPAALRRLHLARFALDALRGADGGGDG